MGKKLLSFGLLVLFSISFSFAQKVALHSSTGAQHFLGINGLINAYNSANHGDTIYIPGGTFNSPSTINKRLIIFGAGHYLDSSLVGGKTIINGNLTLSDSADNTYLEGFEVNGDINFTANQSINYVSIIRCKFNGLSITGNINPSNNLSFIGCVFNGINLENAQNVLVSNNIIISSINNTNSNLICNNIIFQAGIYVGYYTYTAINGNNNVIKNNIFRIPNVVNGQGNTLISNLSNAVDPNFGANAQAYNNMLNIADSLVFVNQTGNTFNYSHNYHLKSPNLYLGDDNTQVGIYGGSFPYKEGAVPLNPHIRRKIIANQTNNNGELQIEVEASAQSN